MSVRIVRLGEPRQRDEGPRLGTVRRPPRGIRKEDYARLDYYDLWYPDLAPSPELFAWARAHTPFSDKDWTQYEKRFRREMSAPARQRLIALLALLSRASNFSVGCYCEDETRCHRSILRDLLQSAGAEITR